MRAIPSSMDPTIVAAVDERLAGVEAEHQLTIPWAIESGSRAWGFPSPDSDYDCRFIYVRRTSSYLTPWPVRDVIETPLDKVFDVNGWDLAKAIRLLAKGNATVTEWLRSPIVYAGDEVFRDGMLELASSLYNPVLAGRHYLHVGLAQTTSDVARLPLKRVFYALRPAATLRWMRENSGVPPMRLQELLSASSVPADFRAAVDELIAVKSVTREIGRGVIPAPIVAFIKAELQLADEMYSSAEVEWVRDAVELGNEYFREVLGRVG